MFIKNRSPGSALRHGQELTVLQLLWEHSLYEVRHMLLAITWFLLVKGRRLTSEWTANSSSIVAAWDGSLIEA